MALMTVSDTRTLENDKSGQILRDKAIEAGHHVRERVIVQDDLATIVRQLTKWVDARDIDVVISTGGTGLTGRDVTVEAHQSLYEKEITGFATIFALVSFSAIKASAVQSRACAGVANGTYLFALPGSPGACLDAWEAILRPQLDIRNRPCNFVEIMPRLEEHKRQK